MGRIGSLYQKSLILGIKDVYVLLEIGFSVVILMLLLFVVPEDINRDPAVYIYDQSGLVQSFVDEHVGLGDAEESSGEFYVNNRDELIAGMVEEKSAVGIIIQPRSDGTYDVELLTQPYTTEAMVKYIQIDLEDLIAIIAPPFNHYPEEVMGAVRVEALQWGLRDEIPFNKRLLPTILMFMVGTMGLFIMISLIGQERSEATLRAYRVTPGKMWEFLVSKHLVMLSISVITFSILYLPLIGFTGYPSALLIMVLTVIFGSAVGTLLGAVFETPMNAVLWVFVLMIVFVLPSVSLFSPVFSPGWLKVVPTYHTLFGLDAAMFPDNNANIIWQSAGILAAIDVVVVAVSFWLFGKLVGKEA